MLAQLTSAILHARIILGGGKSPVYCRRLNSISGQSTHQPPVVSSSCDNPKPLQTSINVPEGAKGPQPRSNEIDPKQGAEGAPNLWVSGGDAVHRRKLLGAGELLLRHTRDSG